MTARTPRQKFHREATSINIHYRFATILFTLLLDGRMDAGDCSPDIGDNNYVLHNLLIV
jgi:hypothetical protein